MQIMQIRSEVAEVLEQIRARRESNLRLKAQLEGTKSEVLALAREVQARSCDLADCVHVGAVHTRPPLPLGAAAEAPVSDAQPVPLAQAQPAVPAKAPVRLTARELEVLRLIGEGHRTKEIAYRLHITFKTAVSHKSHIMDKLAIHDVLGLVRYAIRHKICEL